MLSAYDLSGDKIFLEKSLELADKLMPSLNTTRSGMSPEIVEVHMLCDNRFALKIRTSSSSMTYSLLVAADFDHHTNTSPTFQLVKGDLVRSKIVVHIFSVICILGLVFRVVLNLLGRKFAMQKFIICKHSDLLRPLLLSLQATKC